jgi:hypothetical protein
MPIFLLAQQFQRFNMLAKQDTIASASSAQAGTSAGRARLRTDVWVDLQMHCVHKIFTRTERMESASAYSCVLDGELKSTSASTKLAITRPRVDRDSEPRLAEITSCDFSRAKVSCS